MGFVYASTFHTEGIWQIVHEISTPISGDSRWKDEDRLKFVRDPWDKPLRRKGEAGKVIHTDHHESKDEDII